MVLGELNRNVTPLRRTLQKSDVAARIPAPSQCAAWGPATIASPSESRMSLSEMRLDSLSPDDMRMCRRDSGEILALQEKAERGLSMEARAEAALELEARPSFAFLYSRVWLTTAASCRT